MDCQFYGVVIGIGEGFDPKSFSVFKEKSIQRLANVPRIYSFPQSLQYSRLLFP